MQWDGGRQRLRLADLPRLQQEAAQHVQQGAQHAQHVAQHAEQKQALAALPDPVNGSGSGWRGARLGAHGPPPPPLVWPPEFDYTGVVVHVGPLLSEWDSCGELQSDVSMRAYFGVGLWAFQQAFWHPA